MFKTGVLFLVLAAVVSACDASPAPTAGPIVTLPPESGPLVTTPNSGGQGPGGTHTHGSQGPTTNGGSATPVLYVENRGGDAFNIQIAGVVVATVECGQTVTLEPGQGNAPALPWVLNVTRVSDGATVLATQIVRLPQWLVRRPGFQPTLGYSEADGTFAPCTS